MDTLLRRTVTALLALSLMTLALATVADRAAAWPNQDVTVASCCPPNANSGSGGWSPLTKARAEYFVANAFPGPNGAPAVVQATANVLQMTPCCGGFPGYYKLVWIGSNNTRRNADGTVWAYVFIYKYGNPLEAGWQSAYCEYVAHVGLNSQGDPSLWNSNIDYVGGSPSSACFYYTRS